MAEMISEGFCISLFEAFAHRLAICLVIALRSVIESPTTPLFATRADPGAEWRLRGHPQMRQRPSFEDISGDATRVLDIPLGSG